MNTSRSPVHRPLSNISNKKLTNTNLQGKLSENSQILHTPNSAIIPQKDELRKLSSIEGKTSTQQKTFPKSSITTFTSEQKENRNSLESRKSSQNKKKLSQQSSSFHLFKIIVILGIVALSLLIYQWTQSTSNQQIKMTNEMLLQKEKMTAYSVSNSIINQIIYENKQIDIQKEKEDIKQFYQNEFSQSLWKQIIENINNDQRIRRQKINDNEYWTL